MITSEASNTSDTTNAITEEERRAKRLKRDRNNARARRKRRKLRLIDLENNHTQLSIENARLQRENNLRYQEMLNLSQELNNLRSLCRMLQQSAGGVTMVTELTTPRSSPHVYNLLTRKDNPRTIDLPHQVRINPSNLSYLSLLN